MNDLPSPDDPSAPSAAGIGTCGRAPSRQRRRWWRSAWAPVLVLAAVVSLWAPWWRSYEINPDEGINLMKGALVASGYRLYSEIWSDQPPLLTGVLAGVERLAPRNVAVARLVILGFAGLIVSTLFRMVRRRLGILEAWFAVLLMLASPLFLWLSVSVMVGLPAVALALLALEQAMAPGGVRRQMAAGALFALSLQIKLFTVTALPALLLACSMVSPADPPRRRRRRLAGLAAGTVAVYLLVVLVFRVPLISQLLAPHVAPYAIDSFEEALGVRGTLATLHGKLMLATMAAALAAAVMIASYLPRGGWWGRAVARRPWLAPEPPRPDVRWVPLLWLAVAVIALAVHRPPRDHHALLLLAPAAWLGAGALAWARKTIGRLWPRNRRAPAVVAVLTLLVAAPLLGRSLTEYRWRVGYVRRSDRSAGRAVARFTGRGRWLITDRVMDGIRAGLLVPPELAVFSEKRRLEGELSDEQLEAAVDRWRVGQVVMRRGLISAGLASYLLSHGYHEIFDVRRGRHFVRDFGLAIGPDITRAELANVAHELARRSTDGGYANVYRRSDRSRYERTVGKPLADNQIVVRPPGSTPEIGACFLRLHAAGDDFLDLALAAGRSLACAQGVEGGWRDVATLRSDCREAAGPGIDTVAGLDESEQSITLGFLFDLEQALADEGRVAPEWLRPSIRRALDFLVKVQLPSGGWPQNVPPAPDIAYQGLTTLNDGVTPGAISALLRGARRLGAAEYLEAARRGGDLLLHTQANGDQGGWAQQYDNDLQPAAARAFEPVALASVETAMTIRVLLELHQETGDPRPLAAALRAASWLERSRLAAGGWARFYEIGTNRPIYVDRDGVVHDDLNAISPERRTGYDWRGRFPVVEQALELSSLAGAGRTIELASRLAMSDAPWWIHQRSYLEDPGAPRLRTVAPDLFHTEDLVAMCRVVTSPPRSGGADAALAPPDPDASARHLARAPPS